MIPSSPSVPVPPLDALLPPLVELAHAAGRAIEACAGGALDVRRKADGSPVGRADTDAHAVIMAGLRALTPGVPIVSEEGDLPAADQRAAWTTWWLVDPLDGTKEYLAGVPDYTVNIALIRDGVPVLGVVHASGRGVTYYGAEGQGSWRLRDGLRARLTAAPPAPGRALTIVESRSHGSPDMEAFLRPYRIGARVAIGSSLKFCLVADGTADVYIRLGPTMEWDVAAGDAVFRWATGSDTPHASQLAYGKADLRNGPFVLGFLPPPPCVVCLTGSSADGRRAIADAVAARLAAAGAAIERLDGHGPASPAYLASRLEAHGVTVLASPARQELASFREACRRVVDVQVAEHGAEAQRPAAVSEGAPAIAVDLAVESPDHAAGRIVDALTRLAMTPEPAR